MGHLYKADGRIIEILPSNRKRFTATELSHIVGSTFRAVLVPDDFRLVAFLPEYDSDTDLPVNENANVRLKVDQCGMQVIGDVLFCTPEEYLDEDEIEAYFGAGD